MAHKPGSRKGKVHECFDTKGPEAAVALAAELGLAPGTARSWMNSWSKETGVKLPKAAAPATNGERAPRKRRLVIDPTKRRVYDVSLPDIQGTVIEEGPEVTTVRWDFGEERHVGNKYLRTVGEPSKGKQRDR